MYCNLFLTNFDTPTGESASGDSSLTLPDMHRAQHIEVAARRLYAELRLAGRCSLEELSARTQLPMAESLLAVGWLVRDGRVTIEDGAVQLLASNFYF